uniref:Uncharacterized protein n=1 Tax=Picea sitchensis TaxID=3332 RepID=A9NP73_PICSI|nr:unknown [Picea sitchensis]ABK25425.1 unknown [Picea sitchensis]
MEIKKAVHACILLVMLFGLLNLVVCSVEDEINGFSLGQPQTLHKDRHLLALNCGSACGKRCALASVKDRCLKYCGICCSSCQCVPPGTYGNKNACPCYRDMKNAKGKPKCP